MPQFIIVMRWIIQKITKVTVKISGDLLQVIPCVVMQDIGRGKMDLGVISPTAALSSFPYTPEQSMNFLKYLYLEADSLVGEYGPYDAYSQTGNWYLPRYLAIDQGPIPVMIENYRRRTFVELIYEE